MSTFLSGFVTCVASKIYNLILNFSLPAGAAVPKWLPLYPVGAGKELEVSLGERRESLGQEKAPHHTVGLLKLLLAQS